MESDERPAPPPEGEAPAQEAPDRATIERAREILGLLVHTVTAMKLFPAHHATVTGFVDDLYAKLRAFFETRSELDLDVQDQAFILGGEVVHKEEHLAKSIPYLFHKDGMKKFAILREIDKTELRDFLGVVRKTALLPLDESDVVQALWEKDLPNVRIFAPDEYLLSKIDIFTKQPLDVFIDRRKLFSGQIALSEDDLKDIQDKALSLGLMELEEKKDFAELLTALQEKDQEAIEALLAAVRRIPPEREFQEMIFELLCLEDRVEKIVPVLEFLERHHRELIREGKFTPLVQLITQTKELQRIFSTGQSAKADELKKFLGGFPDGRIVELVQEAIGRGEFDSLPSFFDYLGLMGDRGIPLAAELLAKTTDPEIRRTAIAYLEEAGRRNLELLASQLQDGQPAVSKEIIALLGRNPSKKVLSYLAALKIYTSQEVKLAAIEVLGSMADPLAQKIIFEYFQDKDDDVSAAAAGRLRWPGDPATLERVIGFVLARPFHDRGTNSKIAVLTFLARAATSEALEALQKTMEKSGLFARALREHTRLCLVVALDAVGTPAARGILTLGLASPNKKVSEACEKALGRRAQDGEKTG
jgi:HEAT repeat protein